MPWRIGAERVDGHARTRRSCARSVFHLHARESIPLIFAAIGVPSVGRVCDRRLRACGRRGRTGRPAMRRPSKGLRAPSPSCTRCRSIVEQPVRHLVRLPDLVEQRLWHLAPPESRRDDREQGGPPRRRRSRKWCGQVGVERHAVRPRRARGGVRRTRVRPRRARPVAVSRLAPGSLHRRDRSGGARGGPPGASVVGAIARSAAPGWPAVSTFEAMTATRVAAALAAGCPHDREPSRPSSRRSSCESRSSSPRRRFAPRRSSVGLVSPRLRPERASERSRRCVRPGRAATAPEALAQRLHGAARR